MFTQIKILILVIVFSFSSSAVLINQALAQEANATLSLAPSNTTIANGESVSLSLRADSDGISVNAVRAVLNYNVNDFKATISSFGESFEQSVASSVNNGQITIERKTSTPKTGSLDIATITLTALRSDRTSPVTYDGMSALFSSESGADILMSVSNGFFVLKDPSDTPSPQPEPEPEPVVTPIAVGEPTVTSKGSSYTVAFTASKTADFELAFTDDASAEISLKTTSSETPEFDLTKATLTPGRAYSYVLRATTNEQTTTHEGSFTTPGYTLIIQVNDSNDAVVRDASVTINSVSANTNQDGQATINNLTPDNYEVTVVKDNITATTTIAVNQPEVSTIIRIPAKKPFPILPALSIATLTGIFVLAIAVVQKHPIRLPKPPKVTLPKLPKRTPKTKVLPKRMDVTEATKPPKPPKDPNEEALKLPGVKNPDAGNVIKPTELSEEQKMMLETFSGHTLHEIEQRVTKPTNQHKQTTSQNPTYVPRTLPRTNIPHTAS